MSNIHVIKSDFFRDLDEEKIELFLSYFNKVLEEEMVRRSSGGGSIGYLDDGMDPLLTGDFKNKDYIGLKMPHDKVITLCFTSYWKKGIFDYIEISSDIPKEEWIEYIEKKVQRALLATIAKKTEKFFFRSTYNYIGSRLAGEYYFPGWRLVPATPIDAPKYKNAESIFYLDMEVEGIHEKHARSKCEAKCNEITAILSLLLDKGIYKPSDEYLWGTDPLTNKSNLFLMRYEGEEDTPSKMPKKDKKKLGRYSELHGIMKDYPYYSPIELPQNTRRLFRAFEKLSMVEKEAFLSAARMYQISISVGKNIDTVSSAYRIAALDALSKPLRENNQNKNAIISLVKKYYPSLSFEKKVAWLYENIRSAHFHQGVFKEQDIQGPKRELFKGPRDVFPRISEDDLHIATRAILIRWLSDKIPKDEN
ncbi:hypothetical protein ACU80C_12000 [Bacillus mycoides]|uniref:hypothetical protein n=1 Tax=Bacillus mycoides TaxID=1405 RepID=UPI00065B943A|nr:hypothetical protein [Bacillus mycoides]KMQ12771.1 hypothetical protein TU70_28410 [Bacillus mycoides]QWH97205.1 hypothetical protein EXW36_11775 [Bacillus mycoides]